MVSNVNASVVRDSGLSEVLFECSPDCVKLLDAAGGILLFNTNGLCVMEIDDPQTVQGVYWPDLWPAESRATVEASLTTARAAGSAAFVAPCPTAKGTPKLWEVSVTAVPGDAERFIVASRDITRQRALEEENRDTLERLRSAAKRQETLAAELSHRVTNTLAVVSGVFRQTARASSSLQHFTDVFSSRLASMASASRILVDGAWSGADLEELARVQLAPFAGADRVTYAGPAVTLNVEVAQAIALALNELATNAMKHGALGAPEGAASLSWTVADDDGGALRIAWRERGGPAVTPPVKHGLGSRLIERGIPDATVERRFDPSGLICMIALPARHFTAS